MLRTVLFAVLTITVCTSAMAQESRERLIHQIVEAQGIKKTFEEQISQQRDGMEKYATQVYAQIVAGFGGKESDNAKAVYAKYMRNIYSLITVDEMTSAWESSYGSNLSDGDLVQILTYYNSAVGKKDVASSRAAAKQFTSWMLALSHKRSEALLGEFVRDLKASY